MIMETRSRAFITLMIVLFPVCWGFTDPRDVYAISSLYAALGSPPLPGWIPFGGDPCTDGWQGVQCVNANITAIILNGANLGGELSEDLGYFASIIQIDLSNNHIGGSIPSNLPVTLRTFSLSDNQLTGSIPDTLSTLGQLTDLSLNNNHLTGAVPDAFQQLRGLINIDLSANSLTGQLPPSMNNLSSLTTMHVQNNQLSGTLDVIQDLPLIDLNIENNLFSGPIPQKLLSIPNFRRAGNPFNTTIISFPPISAPVPSPVSADRPALAPRIQSGGPSSIEIPHTQRGASNTHKSIRWITIAGLLVLIVLFLGLCLFMIQCYKRKKVGKEEGKCASNVHGHTGNLSHGQSLQKPYYQDDIGPKDMVVRRAVGYEKDHVREPRNIKRNAAVLEQKHHEINMSRFDTPPQSTHAVPFSVLPAESMIRSTKLLPVNPLQHSMRYVNSVKSFSIASLQQYTNSFSQENCIGGGMVGTVYRAELSDGQLLAVKKLDISASRLQSDEEFLGLVSTISRLSHENIVKLVGYCMEHGQRLLVYEYFRNGTLHEALHLDDVIHKKLSWNARIRLALQAARALEYLHEVCQPPVIHQDFKSANILLDDELTVHVSDCGLAPVLESNAMTQLQGYGYGAPELEQGNYTHQSDVFSFGVVMLELLTGRSSFDRSRPRGQQFLVRWALPQLHDIDALSRMVDPSLSGGYTSKSLSRFADIISLCTQPEPEFRPPMSEIVQNLLQMIQKDH